MTACASSGPSNNINLPPAPSYLVKNEKAVEIPKGRTLKASQTPYLIAKLRRSEMQKIRAIRNMREYYEAVRKLYSK